MIEKSRIYPIYLVAGMSGAGRSSCLHILEDMGFKTIDNLPLFLLEPLVEHKETFGEAHSALAIGIDIRHYNFQVDHFISAVENFKQNLDQPVKILYLDCNDISLISRYKQTRRPHPMQGNNRGKAGEKAGEKAGGENRGEGGIEKAVQKERQLLIPLKEKADIVIDSSGKTVWQFRNRIKTVLGHSLVGKLNISVMSFSFAREVPRDADLVFDVRFLQNPHYIDRLRPLTGRDLEVQKYISQDKDWENFLERIYSLLDLTLPRYEEEGKSSLTIAIGCTGGRHRSVYVAEILSQYLKKDWPVYLVHQRLDDM